MILKSLRDLVEGGAAAHKIAPRKLWRWTFDGILQDELEAQFPHDPSRNFNTPSDEEAFWRKVLENNRDADVSLCGWTSDLKLDLHKFEQWLKKRCRDAAPQGERPGPKSNKDKMRDAYNSLLVEGAKGESKKADHRAVLIRCGIEEFKGKLPYGWSYHTFLRALEGEP
jgi:hypothetical protein